MERDALIRKVWASRPPFADKMIMEDGRVRLHEPRKPVPLAFEAQLLEISEPMIQTFLYTVSKGYIDHTLYARIECEGVVVQKPWRVR